MTETITWLHISDTHFCREKHDWDCQELFDTFFTDLKKMESECSLIPDLLFFTGDIAFGQENSNSLFLEKQYIEAQEFIEKVSNSFSKKIPTENIFIVPGNHDVNRTQITSDQIYWLKNIQKIEKEKASETINDHIKSKSKLWIRCMERLGDYRLFLERGGYNHLLDDPERLIYSKTCQINGFKIGILGLNSAWSSSGDGEKGNLWLGTYQILSSYNSLKDAMFSISLIHHPPSWFTETEEQDIKTDMERRFNFCLHGHVHQEWVNHIDEHIRISSGALYNGSGKINSYNFVRLYPEEDRGEVFLREYNNGCWTPHIIGKKTTNDGIYNLQLNIPNLKGSINTGIKKDEITINSKSNIETPDYIENHSSKITNSKPLNPVGESQICLKVFHSTNEFFSRYIENAKLLNHTYIFVGQQNILSELDSFIESEKKIALLYGRGGIGKSRILLEFGKKFELRNCEWELRFINENLPLTHDSINELPEKKCIIVADNAHRRKDILTLLEIAQQASNPIKIILAFRPQGLNYIKNSYNRCGFDTREIEEISEVQDLKREEKEKLGKDILGQEYYQYLESLLRVAKDSTLVLVIGARLLVEKQVSPDLLELNNEFRDVVFRRFKEDILSGIISDDLDTTSCQDILSIVSILSPIQKDARFIEKLSEFLHVKKSKLNQIMDTLERNRVLLRIGSKLRLTPDILSDHILHNSCITSFGDSTCYSQEVFEDFRDIYFENILKNLVKLDWMVNKQQKEIDLLVGIWEKIVEEFKNSSNSDRAVLLEKFGNVAYFQPKRTLELIDYAINNPLETPEKDSELLYNFTHNNVLGKIPTLLSNIIYIPTPPFNFFIEFR